MLEVSGISKSFRGLRAVQDQGLGYDEIRDILGVNRDALKMRVYKARTLLCRSLAHLVAR